MGTVGFGTSGLRGAAAAFGYDLVARHVGAFLETACAGASGREVAIGLDLRASSPAIAGLVASALRGSGRVVINAGVVPTPALAAFALDRAIPAIMVTGSHIPADYNGLKFYRPDGELLKQDEAPIEAAARTLVVPEYDGTGLPPVVPEVAAFYRRRFARAFATDALKGLRIGLFAHSAAGRGLLAEIVAALGAELVVFGGAAAFEAVDTEAVEPGHMVKMRAALAGHGLDAVISTDGDGDRPLLLDETGAQVNGDVLGALAGRALGIDTLVTPLTSTSAIEQSGWFATVLRTRIGSPHVVAAMAGARGRAVAGFEANGGFLLGSELDLPAGRLAPLLTRDAVLPLLTVLAAARARGLSVSGLAAELPPRIMKADRLRNVTPARGVALIRALAERAEARHDLAPILGQPLAIDTTDGTRFVLAGGTIIHFRQSGNAPELRCYVETETPARTEALLGTMMERLAAHFEDSHA